MKKNVLLLFLVISVYGCEDADVDIDFRDKYIGLYKGIETYGHIGDTVTWESETTSYNISFEVAKIYDSSFVVTIDDFSFQTDHHFDNRYVCQACSNGPWHFIEFIEDDSAIVYRRETSFSSYTYYGKKE